MMTKASTTFPERQHSSVWQCIYFKRNTEKHYKLGPWTFCLQERESLSVHLHSGAKLHNCIMCQKQFRQERHSPLKNSVYGSRPSTCTYLCGVSRAQPSTCTDLCEVSSAQPSTCTILCAYLLNSFRTIYSNFFLIPIQLSPSEIFATESKLHLSFQYFQFQLFFDFICINQLYSDFICINQRYSDCICNNPPYLDIISPLFQFS